MHRYNDVLPKWTNFLMSYRESWQTKAIGYALTNWREQSFFDRNTMTQMCKYISETCLTTRKSLFTVFVAFYISHREQQVSQVLENNTE